MFVIRKKLAASDITPPNIRWNEDCSCVQQTFDGGTTWVDAPGQDPRSSPGFRAPPLTTSDPRCDAAANMLAKLHAAVDMAIAFDNSVRLAGEMFALFALAMPALGVIVAVFTIIADVLLAIGGAAIDGSFTSAVYDDLLCVFYNHIDADGQMSDSQLADIYSDIAAHFDIVVQAVFGAVSSAAGAVGWSNSGALGTATGDCTSCSAWCYTFDFTIDEQGFNDMGGQAIYAPGVGWQTTNYTGGPSYRYLAVGRTVAMTITEISMEFSYSSGTLDPTGDNTLLIANDGFAAPNLVVVAIPATPTSPATWMGSQTLSGIALLLLSGAQFGSGHDPGGSATLTRLTLHGTGGNPFGSDNC